MKRKQRAKEPKEPRRHAPAPVPWRQRLKPYRQEIRIGAGLAVLVLLVYGRVTRYGFVSLDDDSFIYENPPVLAGLTWQTVLWAFQSLDNLWQPATWLSHMLDIELFGLNAGGHHWTNVMLHAASGVLLFVFLRMATGRLWPSAVAAALFAVHPLRVESVAWVSERKDTLSVFLFLLTLIAYLRYAASPSRRRYWLLIGGAALALMAKPMLVTIPVLLLLIDVWPLSRYPATPLRQLIAEKIPIAVMAAAVAVATVIAQRGTESMTMLGPVPLTTRLANAAVSPFVYLAQTFWPWPLAVLYPFDATLPLWKGAAAAAATAVITALSLWWWPRLPWLAFGWLWYLISLLPVIGVVQVGAQAHADRYTYLPHAGLVVAIVWSVVHHWKQWRLPGKPLAWAAGVIILVLAAVTWVQIGYWSDSVSLFEHTLKVTRDNYMIRNNLGEALLARGRKQDAIPHLREALRLRPDYPECLNSLGAALAGAGETDEAMRAFREAVRLRPAYGSAHYNMAVLLRTAGRSDEAMAAYREALKHALRGRHAANAHDDLGVLLSQRGEREAALREFDEALRYDQVSISARKNRAITLLQLGRSSEALAEFRMVLALDPRDRQAQAAIDQIMSQGARGPM